MYDKPISKTQYLIGLVAIYVAVYSQYPLGIFGKPWRLIYVYGIPILAVILLTRSIIFKKALVNNKIAIKYGLAFYSLFILLGMGAASLITYLIARYDPSAFELLLRPNPVLRVSPEYAKLMILLSFLAVGPAEEYIFRGFVYGGLLDIFRNRHWILLAVFSSVLFATAHFYYVLAYDVSSLAFLVNIMFFGIAMCFPYYLSGGNLLIPILFHGFYDAVGYLSIVEPTFPAVRLRYGLIIAGLLVLVIILIQKVRHRPKPA